MESHRSRRSALLLAILVLSFEHFVWYISDLWEDLGQSQTLSCRRTSTRKKVVLILAAILVIALDTIVEGVLDNHGNTYRPPGLPPWNSMRLLEMRRYGIHKKCANHHPRLEEEGPSGQSCAMDEECRDQIHNKLKLCFHGSLKSRIYTNKPLLAQSNGGIEIVICRNDQIITSGHLASLRVEVVALESDHSCKGDWTEDDFDRQIRKSRDGQGSVLDGERFVKLVNGRASLGNIHFKESSTGTRTREFVLAARVSRSDNVGRPRVEETFMHPPFMVLVERSKVNEKSCIPKLGDKVHDLEGIAKRGPYATRFGKENIYTVQDFLKVLNKDPDKLQQIMEMKSKKQSSWETIVRHARECDLTDRHELKSYKVETENVTLFFNCVDDLVGAEFHDHFVAKEKFGERQKALVDTQLKQAYGKLDEIKFDYVMEGSPMDIGIHDLNMEVYYSSTRGICLKVEFVGYVPNSHLRYRPGLGRSEAMAHCTVVYLRIAQFSPTLLTQPSMGV